jgi:hypothetical protein
VDYDRANVYAIENLVTSSPSTESLANVINTANSRYITKKINLQQNANNLNVYLSVNNKYPSSIDVYYRYLPASSDSSIVFDDQNYILMSKISGSDYTKENEYRELQFGVTGATAFNTFGVKVVMKSSDGTVVPKIQNMRIVAT